MDNRALVFTVHKAASLGVYDVMRRVASHEKWPLHSANHRKKTMTEPNGLGDEKFFAQLDGKTGLVGPIRAPVALPEDAVTNDTIIIHLRDPRDVLVSMFYSWSYSHPGVDEAWRKRLIDRGVDEFVWNENTALKNKYRIYARKMATLPNATLVKYEDFVLDRPAWMHTFLSALGLDPEIPFYKKLANDNPAAKVTAEDKSQHIRKAAPGDYAEKLRPETIEKLNTNWEQMFGDLGYSL